MRFCKIAFAKCEIIGYNEKRYDTSGDLMIRSTIYVNES